MGEDTIHADKKFNYLNEFMTELPVNCLFDKGKTGCGGTTIAIENDKDTIIAMPYVNVIKNKIAQYPNERCDKVLFGIYEGVTETEILDYIVKNKIRKIAVTYDSLERLINLMVEKTDIDVYNDFYLLVDEWHILFNSYAFRNSAVKKVLHHSRLFKEVTYMTATPIEEEFILKELKNMPIKEVQWENTATVSIKSIATNRPINEVCRLINDTINDKSFGNLHFFVNSVEFIVDTIKKTNLKSEQVRIICSNNSTKGKGRKSNQKKLGDNYLIEDTIAPVKKINFYTSTAFEGCDIYDEQGKTYIVSDKYKSHTLLDISTLIIQICGRIRNSKYQLEATHIFTETRYNKFLSLDEFKQNTQRQLEDTKRFVNDINNIPEESRKTTIGLIEKKNKEGLNEKYIFNNNNYLEVDENLLNLDIVNFKITNHLYQSRITLRDEYMKYGFNITEEQKIIYTDKLKTNLKAKISFKDLFEEYVLLREEQPHVFHFGNPQDRRSLIEKEKPIIKEAYEIMGIERVREMKYNVTNIKREIFKLQTNISMDAKIVKCLIESGVCDGCTNTSKSWKDLLQSVYTSLDYKDSRGNVRKAEATHLDNWFEIKKTTPKIKGKTTDCYTIIRSKMIYK